MATSTAAVRWRRTEFAILASVFLYFAGVSFVVPFLPLYVVELDGYDIPTAAAWSGLILGVTPMVSGIVAPFWGRLSDRFGQKVLLQRSLIGFTICLGLMAIAESSVHLFVLRACMGLVGGFSVTAQTMVSVGAPREAVTSAIGRTNAARLLGMAIGPVPGGVLADTVGIRGACVASVLGGIVALAIVTLLADAPRLSSAASLAERPRHFRVLTAGFLTLLSILTTLRVVEKSFDPVIPLLINALDDKPFGVGVSTAVVSSGGLLATALGSSLAGRLVGQDPVLRRRRLVLLLVTAALLMVAMFFAGTWWLLLAVRVAAGFVVGVALAVAMAQVALSTPVARRGTAMGIIGSGSSFGSAGGQLGAGMLAVILLPAVFLVDAAFLITSALVYVAWNARTRPDDASRRDSEGTTAVRP